MAQESKLKGRKRSWKDKALRIEWHWERRGWDYQIVRQVYQLYQDWDKFFDKCGQAQSVIRKFYGRGKSKLTPRVVRDMVGSYKNYLKAIKEGCHVEPEVS